MKKGLTELVFILDKSGSMGGLETDTIGGYNSMLAKQQAVEGECHITTVLFDNNYELLHDRIDIKAVSPITEKEYQVGGSTALLDAIGRTIHKIGNAQKHTADDYRAAEYLILATVTLLKLLPDIIGFNPSVFLTGTFSFVQFRFQLPPRQHFFIFPVFLYIHNRITSVAVLC